ncbi:dockerin type I repeat-containing protein [Ruminococcus flavefaciens]|uniref:Dockerin domain-containing protein n=1 Tax=Ruminococcus flavefaciens 007c TaxID=1341157 RepID=W7UKT7_RUMFL|nr:dockerin type I repeat-containing protein [Ruminococcus flavefaciens]EWM52174.1 hypothetical protein RF007C_02010 [Ruminococcus flavefaciens 007c]
MKLKTKLLTILTEAVMITSAAAPSLTEAYAEEISTGNIRAADYTEDYSVDSFPDWVPSDFASAVEFGNKYGEVLIKDGYICCVHRMKDNGRGLTKSISSVNTVNYNEQENFQVLDKTLCFPTYDENTEGSYEEYLAQLKKLGVSERDMEYVDKSICYGVDVFKPANSILINLAWTDDIDSPYTANADNCRSFIFICDENGDITEKDEWGWIPDSITEAREYIENNGVVSIHGKYIVFCFVTSACSFETSQEGVPEIRKSKEYNIGSHAVMPMLGEKNARIILYEASKPGTATLKLNYSGGASKYEPQRENEYSFSFDVDLMPSFIGKEECDKPVLGDCNGDGVFGISDVVHFQKWMIGAVSLKKAENADMNKDGELDIFDLINMKKQLINGTSEFSGIVADPKPMLAVIYLNRAWGLSRRVTVYDENGTGYSLDQTAFSKNSEIDFDDFYPVMGDNTDWYDKMKAVMESPYAKKTRISDESTIRARKMSADIDKYVGSELGEFMGMYNDYGMNQYYLIGSGKNGDPEFVNFFAYGDMAGISTNKELKDFAKYLGYSNDIIESYQLTFFKYNSAVT